MTKCFLFIAALEDCQADPALPLVSELTRRRHRVDFATGPAHLTEVVAAGASGLEVLWELGPATPAAELSDVRLSARMDALVARGVADAVDAVCFDGALRAVGVAVAHRLDVPAISLTPDMAVNELLSPRDPSHLDAAPLGQQDAAQVSDRHVTTAAWADALSITAGHGFEQDLDAGRANDRVQLRLSWTTTEIESAGEVVAAADAILSLLDSVG
jgi:hypothetical protein